jgi:hypothetical protein
MSNNISAPANFSNPFFSVGTHSFNEGIAVSTKSIIAATVFQHLLFWIQYNKIHKDTQHDGRTWMYESIPSMAKYMKYLTEQQIKDGLALLVKHGYIVKGNYSNNKFDHTSWYALSNEEWLDSQKMFAMRSTDPIGAVPRPDPRGLQTPSYNDKLSKEEVIKKEERERARAPDHSPPAKEPEPPPTSHGQFVKLKAGEYDELCETLGKERVDVYIAKINNHIPNSKNGPYKDYAAIIRKWYLEDQLNPQKPKTVISSDTHDEIAKKIQEKFGKRSDIVFGYNYIEFVNGPQVAHLLFGSKDFIDKCKQQLNIRKLEINI